MLSITINRRLFQSLRFPESSSSPGWIITTLFIEVENFWAGVKGEDGKMQRLHSTEHISCLIRVFISSISAIL